MADITLSVVYKKEDSITFNQLKRLVYAKDGLGISYDGAEDKSILVVGYTEREWEKLIRAGDTVRVDKIIYLDVKGIEALYPSLDASFSKYGVTYGVLGKHAFVLMDKKALSKRKDRKSFSKDFNTLYDSKIEKHKELYGDWLSEKMAAVVKKGAISGLVTGVSSVMGTLQILDSFADTLPGGAGSIYHDELLLYGILNFYFNDMVNFLTAK